MAPRYPLLFILIMSTAFLVSCTSETLSRVSLEGLDENAVCNDGSPPSYYWKKSKTGSNRWLIWLMGDGEEKVPDGRHQGHSGN